MATTTVPEVTNVPEVKKAAPVTLTPSAVTKVKEIMGQQNPVPAGLRIGVVGGGCSGFSYSMQFENAAGMMDKTFRNGRPEGVRRRHFRDVSERMHGGLCRNPRRRRLQVRESEREEHLRLRLVIQCLNRISEVLLQVERPHLRMRPFVLSAYGIALLTAVATKLEGGCCGALGPPIDAGLLLPKPLLPNPVGCPNGLLLPFVFVLPGCPFKG